MPIYKYFSEKMIPLKATVDETTYTDLFETSFRHYDTSILFKTKLGRSS